MGVDDDGQRRFLFHECKMYATCCGCRFCCVATICVGRGACSNGRTSMPFTIVVVVVIERKQALYVYEHFSYEYSVVQQYSKHSNTLRFYHVLYVPLQVIFLRERLRLTRWCFRSLLLRSSGDFCFVFFPC